MSSVAVLPATLRDKLAAAARRIRLLRAVRGVSVLLLTLLLFAAAALAADAWLDLPALARRTLFLTWVGIGLGEALFGVFLPLCRRIDPDALAALVEQCYGELGERLTSSVELSGNFAQANGSPALVALLVEETSARTRSLNFPRAVPGRRAAQLTLAAVIALAAFGVTALTMGERFTALVERFLFAGDGPSAEIRYTLSVAPGDAVAARGRPLNVTARLEAPSDNVTLPHSATLIVDDLSGNVTRLPMVADGAAFSYQMENVAGDFQYRIEAGKASSPEYQVTTVEPINVADGGPTLTITPPAYASRTFQPETLTGFHDITALQYSRVRMEVHFTQPAREAVLQWPGDKKSTATSQPLALAADHRGGTLELPALADGPYKLLLKGENGFDTELAGGELIVRVDQPPAVVKFAGAGGNLASTGNDRPKPVLPYESIPLDIALADDVAVASAEVEYRINGGPIQREAIELQGRDTTRAEARHIFRLGGRVKENDEVQYRLRVSDNRNVSEAGLKPQVITFPPDRWVGLKIVGQAPSLAEQEIEAQREDIDARLNKIKKNLEREQRAVYKLRQETRGQPSLLPEQTQELKSQRQENEASREALDQLSREAAEVPPLQDLADKAKEVADEELRKSEKALADAARAEKATPRQRQLNDADKQVTSALSKLEALRRLNDRISRDRLDQAKLDAAAEHQEDLARRAEDVAAKDPVKDAAAKPQAEQLQREQKQVADEVQRAANLSEPLKKALEAARAEQARQLGDKARDLAKEERKLADKPRDRRMEELARKQKELADKAVDLARESRQPTQAAQVPPLNAQNTRQAAEDLKRGDAAEALRNQEQAAKELDRVAQDLNRAAEQARDPKEAAKQLTRLQKDVQQRLGAETKQHNGKVSDATAKAMEKQQRAIAQAAKDLSVPPKQDQMQRDQKEAAEQAAKAGDALRDRNPQRANQKMEQARLALKRLAERIPTMDQRRQAAAAEAEKLRQKQEEVGRQLDKANKLADKRDPQAETKKAEAARKQAEVADRLDKLDAPQQPAARQQAQAAVKKAKDTLPTAKRDEAAASQQNARKQLERLRDALQGKQQAAQPKPGNSPQGMPSKQQAAQAGDFARQQRELRDAVRRLADEATRADQTPQKQLQEQTGQLAKDLDQLAQQPGRSPQSQQAARKAGEAARQAEGAMQQAQNQARQSNEGQAQQAQQQAAQALERAARELAKAGGQPSPAQKQMGQSLQKAQEQMNQAQQQLGKGQPQSAQRSMQRAAQALQQAARQMAKKPGTPKQGGQPNQIGAAPGGKPDAERAALDPKKYAAKRWGELPGSLQTRIIQDLKAKYGDDYTRIIKLYFEEIADTKKK